MNVHEYQAKQIFRDFKVPVPQGAVAEDVDKAVVNAESVGFPCVIKAQVHAGGRGKAGGVRLLHNIEEADKAAREIIGMKLVSKQTGPLGKQVRKVLIEQALEIKKELYLAIIVDREREMPVIIASTEGGMEIEEVAAKNPELIAKIHVHPVTGFSEFHFRKLAYYLGLTKEQQKNFSGLIKNLYKLFMETDASLVEINPLIITDRDEVVALDGKINFDDNALFKHSHILEMRDLDEEEPLEVEASKHDLNYIRLDGNIGCMVNGAGLAMATMDIIKYYGGEPANFLDVGGGTSEDRVKEAFKLLLADKNVKTVFVNIFGGIVRTDLVARGIVNAIKVMEVNMPIVIRLVGTNEEEGRKIIRESGIDFVVEMSLPEAAQKAVNLSKGA